MKNRPLDYNANMKIIYPTPIKSGVTSIKYEAFKKKTIDRQNSIADVWDKFCEEEFNRIMKPRKKKTFKEKLHTMISNLKDFLNAKILSKITSKT
jgi:hypothetical protein